MNVGLIAHDAKKKLMQNFCIAYRGILNKHTLYATGTTGRLIEEVANLCIKALKNGNAVIWFYIGDDISTCVFISVEEEDAD